MAIKPTGKPPGRPHGRSAKNARRDQFVYLVLQCLIRDLGKPRRSADGAIGAGEIARYLLAGKHPSSAPSHWLRKTVKGPVLRPKISNELDEIEPFWEWLRQIGEAMGIDKPVCLSPSGLLKIYDKLKPERPWDGRQVWTCWHCSHENQAIPDRGHEAPMADTPCRRCGAPMSGAMNGDG